MDSSEIAKNASSIEELSYQNYMSNLPPIESVYITHPSQDFRGLNPPALAFSSPRDNSQCSKNYPTENGVDSLDNYKKSLCRTEKDLDSQNHASSAQPLSTDYLLANLHTGELLQPTEVDEREKIEGDDAQCCEREGGMSRRCLQFKEGAVARNVTSLLPQPLIFSSRERVKLYLQDHRNSSRHAANTCFGSQRVNSEIYPLAQPITSFPPASHVHDQRKVTNENAPNPEQFNRPRSPQKKKQRKSNKIGGGSRKQCNCKKSQCVKLYCECFRATNYCDVDCGCEDCYNKPEYEDMVMERKLQITSRNPFAFCPKIEEVRHRRGCNCKVTKCSKKYCECFQADVRCSSACRCNGCDNRPDKEGGYPRAEHVSSEPSLRSILEGDSKLHNNMEMVTNQRDSCHDLHHPTASLQFSGQVKYLPPPQAGTATCPSEWTFSEMSLVPERNEILESGTYGWPLDSNMEMMNRTSSGRCNPVASLHQRTLSHPRSIIFRDSVGRPMTRFGETRHTHILEWNCTSIDKIVEDLKLYEVALTHTDSGELTSSDKARVSPPDCHLRQPGSDSSGYLRSNPIVNSMPSLPPSSPPSTGGSGGGDHQDWGNSTDM